MNKFIALLRFNIKNPELSENIRLQRLVNLICTKDVFLFVSSLQPSTLEKFDTNDYNNKHSIGYNRLLECRAEFSNPQFLKLFLKILPTQEIHKICTLYSFLETSLKECLGSADLVAFHEYMCTTSKDQDIFKRYLEKTSIKNSVEASPTHESIEDILTLVSRIEKSVALKLKTCADAAEQIRLKTIVRKSLPNILGNYMAIDANFKQRDAREAVIKNLEDLDKSVSTLTDKINKTRIDITKKGMTL